MSEYPLEPECLALDPGAGSLRFAYVDNRGCPEPSIVTNIMKDRHYNTMVAMKSSPSFHKKAYYSDARLIVADAFRAKSNYIKGVSFYIQRENDSYKIPSLERQMVEHEKSLLEQEYETISQVKIMSMMLKDISDIIDDRLKRKGIYVCVPDASDIHHRRKLRKALELASIRRQREDDNNVEETASPRSIPEEIDPILFIQQSAAVAQMAFYWIHGNVSDVFRAKKARYIETEIYPRKVVVAITFGAGHFSAGVYEQRSFERYGIIRLFESSDDQLGGEDLNLKLGEWCMKHKDIQPYADELKKSKRLLKFYRDTLEVVKTDLSELDSIATDVEVGEDSIVNVEISQEEFNSVCAGIFKRVEDHLKEVSKYLGEYNITCANIICAGGSTRNPEFEKIIKRVFPNSRIIESINLDECQVLGTGLKAGIRDGIHRLAYAECQDTAMDDCYVTINGVKLYLTKKGESVQNAPERWIKKKKRSNRIPYPDDDNNNLEVETNELKWTPNVESDVHLMIQDYSKIICDKKSTENKEKTNARISTGPQEDTNIHLDTKVNTQDYSTKEIYRQGPHQEPRQSYQIEKDSGTQHQTSSLLSLIYPLHQPETIVLGIDLGTTKIVCATYKIGSSKSEVLTFNDEGKTLPSFVGFDKDGYRSFYGKQALKNLKANPGYVLYDAKRMIGQAYSDRIKLHTPYWAFDVKHNKDNRPVYVLPSGHAKRMIGQAYSDRMKLHTPYWAFDVKHNKDNRPVYVLPSGRQTDRMVFGFEDFNERGEIEITQALFKKLTEELIINIAYICRRILKNTRINASEIDKVLVIGSASNMKVIQDLVRELFPGKIYEENETNVDEAVAVAVGAAIRAAQLKDPNHKNKNNVVEILPIGIGIGLGQNQYNIMINRGTQFPNKIRKRCFTSRDNQNMMLIDIYEGERFLTNKNKKLGKIIIDRLPRGSAGDIYVDITFEFDQNGILTIHANSENGIEIDFTINYKEMEDEGEPIENLIRKLESSRIDSEGRELAQNAKIDLNNNIEYIRNRISQDTSIKDREKLIRKCHDIRKVVNEQGYNETSIINAIQTLEDDAKKAIKGEHLPRI
ncbi:hypothetical protein FO519_002734 [Halicephalobus sp. NKZ332]|nr:hypothetical protein FO519_002734 [Halicephalobus sp. NKZ332]